MYYLRSLLSIAAKEREIVREKERGERGKEQEKETDTKMPQWRRPEMSNAYKKWKV